MVGPRWADTEVRLLETARQSRCLEVVSDITYVQCLSFIVFYVTYCVM